MGTITVNPPANGSPYPVIEDVLNLVRVLVDDTFSGATGTPGEGRVFTDSAPFVLPLLNDAMAQLQRDLEGHSVPRPTMEVIFSNVPPVNGPAGAGVPDPAIFQNLSYGGFFDGLQTHALPALPADFLVPDWVQQRTSNTDLTFTAVGVAPDGLPSRYQDSSIGSWIYQGDRIYWNGATVAKDIRIKYKSSVQFYRTLLPAAFPTTPLPWRDCVQPLAYRIAYMFTDARLPGTGPAAFLQQYQSAMIGMVQRYVRYLQRVTYAREPYGETGDLFSFG